MSIKQIYKAFPSNLDQDCELNGWIITFRSQKDLTFIKVNDGSCPEGIQIIDNNMTNKYKIGMSINVKGKLVKSVGQGQLFEVIASEIKIIGDCMDDYPLSKTKMSLEYLRGFAHLRARTSTFGSVFRIKSAINHATQLFFDQNSFLHLDPNIITTNECEGGAGVFQITENDLSDTSKLPKIVIETINDEGKTQKQITDKYDWSKDHFGKPVYLTVSSQLQLEALACALGNVYTINKSFRSEHSSTSKHLSEFSHLEIESCFINLDSLMDIGERYIKFVGQYILQFYKNDIENLDKFVSKGIKDRITNIIQKKFIKMTYTNAIELAQSNCKQIQYGEDLSSEIENFLTEYLNAPVFITHWPLNIKSFYMKQDCENPELCLNFDLIMPYKVGELIGGSMREDDYNKLIKIMEIKNISKDLMSFYTDLRKYGSVPHGGFGLGLDRMTMLFTGMENIRDTIPFPVAYKSCEY